MKVSHSFPTMSFCLSGEDGEEQCTESGCVNGVCSVQEGPTERQQVLPSLCGGLQEQERAQSPASQPQPSTCESSFTWMLAW